MFYKHKLHEDAWLVGLVHITCPFPGQSPQMENRGLLPTSCSGCLTVEFTGVFCLDTAPLAGLK